MNRCCETCRHDLGGGYDNCRLNLEAECEGGGYEAWRPKYKEDEPDEQVDPGKDAGTVSPRH